MDNNEYKYGNLNVVDQLLERKISQDLYKKK